jgi:hypothetical protein
MMAASSTPSDPKRLSIPGRPAITLTNDLAPLRAELTRKFIEEMKADPSYQFKMPIRFYGKLLDEEEKPLADADVHFKWNKINSANNEIESGEAGTKTDAEGLFSLVGQNGNGVCVAVSKPDYYNLRENPACFEYAMPWAANFHTPDSSKPVVFHLRKKGRGVALITSQNGMRSSLKLSIPMDGMPIKVDLLQQKITETGSLQVSQVKPDSKVWKQATEWSFQMTIPDGGFVEQHDEFPFEAPETGYQPVLQLSFQEGQTNWTTYLKSDYYIRFGNPPRYGRLHLETGIDDNGARLTYAINPDGSRNLEPQ